MRWLRDSFVWYLVIGLSSVQCNNDTPTDIRRKSGIDFYTITAISNWYTQSEECKQEGAVQLQEINLFMPSNACATIRLYDDAIFYYPSIAPVIGNSVPAGTELVCYGRPGIPPNLDPASDMYSSILGVEWYMVNSYSPSAGYYAQSIFTQYYLYDSSGNKIGFDIYTTSLSDNYLLCGSGKYYRILEVI